MLAAAMGVLAIPSLSLMIPTSMASLSRYIPLVSKHNTYLIHHKGQVYEGRIKFNTCVQRR